MVHVTRGLLDLLLEKAADRDPNEITIELAVTPAGEFEDLDLPAETPVFTTFYLPDAGRSIEAVFGSNLATPSGEAPGLFVSHPDGSQSVSRTDDLREIVFVAVPPWKRDSVAAFGRDGRRRNLEALDAEPPRESLPG
jgi:proteasome lid subunit RPN8/RPN11